MQFSLKKEQEKKLTEKESPSFQENGLESNQTKDTFVIASSTATTKKTIDCVCFCHENKWQSVVKMCRIIQTGEIKKS